MDDLDKAITRGYKQMMQALEAEARERGPEALAEVRAHGQRFLLGIELLSARLDARMTMEDLAQASGVSVEEIAGIEQAKVEPSLEVLALLLAPLGKRLSIVPDEDD